MRTRTTRTRTIRTRTVIIGAVGLVVALVPGLPDAGAAAKKTTAKPVTAAAGAGAGGTVPSIRIDVADADIAGVVPPLPSVPRWLSGRTGSRFFAVHVRGYQGAIQRTEILGLADEPDGPCSRLADSGGFSFATTKPGGISWDPVRGADNVAVATFSAAVTNLRDHDPDGCETQQWDDSGPATGSLTVRFSGTTLELGMLGVEQGVDCGGGCPAGWSRLLGSTVTLSAAQRSALANPKVTEVVIPFRYRASFTDDAPEVDHPCFYDEVQRADVNCSWTGASLAHVHLVRLPSQAEFNRVVGAASGSGTSRSPKSKGSNVYTNVVLAG